MGSYSKSVITGPHIVASGVSATAAGTLLTSRVDCLGARSVAFYVRSASGDTDVWATANAATMSVIGPDGSINTGLKTGHSPSTALNAVAANIGTVVYVAPTYGGSGSDPQPNGRIAADQIGLQLTAGAANVTGVDVYAYVIWD